MAGFKWLFLHRKSLWLKLFLERKKNAIIHLNFKVISFVVTIDRLRDGFFMLKNHFVYPASFAGWAFCSISICVVSIDCPNWPFCFHWILQHFIIIETVLGNSVRIRRVFVYMAKMISENSKQKLLKVITVY